MSLCNSECVSTIPCLAGAGCQIVTRPAGIKRVIFYQCDLEFEDITDLEEWAGYIAEGRIGFSGEILGQKPKGTFTTKKLASCLPEQITGAEYQISWIDANSDNDDFSDYDFYKYLQANANNLIAAYLTCDDLLYSGLTNLSLEIDDVRVESSDEEMNFDVVLRYKTPDNTMVKPIKLPGLNAVLTCSAPSGGGEGGGGGEG
jgi:hypothetical protein